MAKPKPLESAKIKLSVALATFNEEKCLSDCLGSVEGLADEIVVVDGSSTDKTVEIAKSFGAKVIVTDNKLLFHLNKQQAIDECRGEWILQLDADEVVTPELAEEIKKVTDGHPPAGRPAVDDAYWVKRKKMFLGQWMKKGGQYPDPVIRFFRNGRGILPAKDVHEQMVIDGEVGRLKTDLNHWATPEFSRYLLREKRYSTLKAKEFLECHLPINPLTFFQYVFFLPVKTFLMIYVRHKGFIDSWQGFVFAFFSGWHYAWAYFKYLRLRIKKVDIQKEWQ